MEHKNCYTTPNQLWTMHILNEQSGSTFWTFLELDLDI